MTEFLDIPKRKTLEEMGLDQFGQSPLKFTGAESNKRSRTLPKHGLPANFVIDGNEGWLQKRSSNASLNVGQDIQFAIEEVNRNGGGSVFLNPGTYKPTDHIYVYSGMNLEGSNPSNTIIDFGGGPYSIKVVGTDAYTTGTISVAEGATAVTGSGTVWTTDMIGQSICLEGLFYTIADVISTTSLTIESGFISTSGDGDLVGENYAIATTINTARISGITIQNSTAPAIELKYTDVFLCNEVFIFECQYGILAEFSSTITKSNGVTALCSYGYYLSNCDGFSILSDYSSDMTVGDGMRCTNSGDATIFNSSFSSCAGNGLTFDGGYNTGILSFACIGNAGKGIDMLANTNDMQIFGAVISNNGSDGVKLTATSDTNQITGMTIKNNGGYGINIAASTCDNNLVANNIFANNSTAAGTDSGTGTLIRSNVGLADAP